MAAVKRAWSSRKIRLYALVPTYTASIGAMLGGVNDGGWRASGATRILIGGSLGLLAGCVITVTLAIVILATQRAAGVLRPILAPVLVPAAARARATLVALGILAGGLVAIVAGLFVLGGLLGLLAIGWRAL
jgi:hypothetical protein